MANTRSDKDTSSAPTLHAAIPTEILGRLEAMCVEDQNRLAREMHDDLGQLIAAARNEICGLQEFLLPNEPRAQQGLETVRDLIDAMASSMRRIMAKLPPRAIEDFGLSGALEAMAAAFEKHHRIGCRYRCQPENIFLDPAMATAIYRVAQESLNNVAKHSGATQVTIDIEAAAGNVVVRITDNGKGMPEDAVQREGVFGLNGIRERTKALQGQFRIESRLGAGTSVVVTIPCENHTVRNKQHAPVSHSETSAGLLGSGPRRRP